MSDDESRDLFARQAWHVEAVAGPLLTEWFGERCLDFDEHCECCKRWRALDELVQNPFKR